MDDKRMTVKKALEMSEEQERSEPFTAAPIADLSMIGIVMLEIDAKKNDERNNKKYK